MEKEREGGGGGGGGGEGMKVKETVWGLLCCPTETRSSSDPFWGGPANAPVVHVKPLSISWKENLSATFPILQFTSPSSLLLNERWFQVTAGSTQLTANAVTGGLRNFGGIEFPFPTKNHPFVSCFHLFLSLFGSFDMAH